MVQWAVDYIVDSGSYDIRNFFRAAKTRDGQAQSEEDKLLPPVTWDPEVEKRLVRKLDFRIMPLVWIIFFIAYINLANVKVLATGTPDSIENSIGTVGTQYNWAISLPYWGFLVAEIPSNIALKKFTARFWLARIIVSWGIVVMCMAAVSNPAGLLVARFVLGLAEAGLIPGVFYYFTFWYKPTERATRNAIFYTAVSVGGGVSGLIAIALERMNGIAGLKAWQWVFILEGIPAIIIGVITYVYLPEFPHSPTTYLTPEEQDVAIRRLPKNAPSMHDKTFVLSEAITLFLQPAQWLFMFSFFCMSFGIVGTSNFLPSILMGMGFTTPTQSNLFSAFPSFWGIITYGIPAWHSDYTRERVWHGLIPSIICTISVALMVTAAKNPPTATNPGFMPNWARYLMFFGIGIQSGSQPVLINFRQSTLGGSTQAGLGISAVLISQAIAQISAPFLFPNSDAPLYVNGLTIAGVVFGMGVGFYSLVPLALRYQNKLARKRMAELGTSTESTDEKAEKDVELAETSAV
ncbi:MFS general substrate transporter [Gonapodya prolifera JEL478]|uniref:MFS general substrate transporter n=1 Tax=Gonapodya prolifera (strain JEL478) TaxID=1344416 RepID=A0A139A4T6_GONPJ|nr:MFS general substrate transporter [Gonapodya prolifera JEL478]|eukprot:KXS11505.1 MFS general substrate transporter [Gonapodya prolifera JEL478]